ncbi:MAG: DNA mismatch repair endonuclease MutL [Bacteroidaceae bacterium]
MSDVIRLLPDSVANQIAAGEVIQRPASVVKELVENAIDAGAREVHVLVTDAGRTCIQVVDDGKGMSVTDARLAFERHATSKIRQAEDLFALHTMGFRGEALASIAAVAQVELKTRMEEDQLGTQLVVAGSKVESQEAVSCPKGSNFAVRNLFYNVPARRKFLKSNQTELNNILTEFERIVLVHPDLSFTFHHNEVEMYSLPAAGQRQRILNVFGKRLEQQLLPMDLKTALGRIYGYVGKPEAARKRGAHQYFFVNGRFMRHPYFHKAVMEAYEQLIPAGEQVPYFIYFEVEPADIDVNVHPTKTEIKFKDEQAIWPILAAAVKETLGKFNAVPTIDFDVADKPDIPVFAPRTAGGYPFEAEKTDYNPFQSSGGSGYSPSRSQQSAVGWESLYDGLTRTEPNDGRLLSQAGAPDAEVVSGRKEGGLYESHSVDVSVQHYQFKGRYVVTSVKSGLMLIDQHRAHVRILFDRYLEQIRSRQGVSQGVLFPEVAQFPSSDVVMLQSIWDDLAAIGFDLSDFGQGSYAINGVPAGVEGLNPVDLLHNMVNTAKEKGSGAKDEVQQALALSLARSAAIVYGQVLSADEMAGLIDNLFACPTPNYTPDGKTVLTIIREEEIEKMF